MQVHKIIKFLFMSKISVFLLVLVVFILVNSCYYDHEELLYPNNTPCDSSLVKYSVSISPILQTSCNGCHSTASPSGNITTDNYNSIKTLVDNGKLWGAINHASGYSAMPKGGNKLTNCELSKFRIWIADGAPNN